MATVVEETSQTNMAAEPPSETMGQLSISDEKLNGDSTIDAKQKKRLDKLVDGVLKRGNNQPASIEEKFYMMAQKYFDQVEATKKVQEGVKTAEKATVAALKQRDQIQNEYTKSLLAQTKLEGICRELQRHNKEIKEENLKRCKEEDEKRKTITTRFQSAIDEINQQVSSNTEKNQALIQENAQLAEKLKSLVAQYEQRESHVEKILKHKDLEIQLADAKFQQSELKFKDLTERTLREKELTRTHMEELLQRCKIQDESEKQLKAQLAVYTEKYQEFQSTLSKSNQVFETFKSEMEKMTKRMKKLEQETNTWKGKYEAAAKSLTNILETKELVDKECKKNQLKAEKMEQLSRQLQTERNNLLQELKKYRQEVPDEKPAAEETTPKSGQEDEAAETSAVPSGQDQPTEAAAPVSTEAPAPVETPAN